MPKSTAIVTAAPSKPHTQSAELDVGGSRYGPMVSVRGQRMIFGILRCPWPTPQPKHRAMSVFRDRCHQPRAAKSDRPRTAIVGSYLRNNVIGHLDVFARSAILSGAGLRNFRGGRSHVRRRSEKRLQRPTVMTDDVSAAGWVVEVLGEGLGARHRRFMVGTVIAMPPSSSCASYSVPTPW